MIRVIGLVLFLCVNSAEAFSGKAAAPVAVPSVTPIAEPSAVPIPDLPGGVEFECISGYCTTTEQKIIPKASSLARAVVQGQCFGSFFTARALRETNGRLNAEVVEHLRSLSGTVPVKMYYRCLGVFPCTSAVGYRQPPAILVNLNRAAFTEKTDMKKWVSVLLHEGYGHALGNYAHAFRWSPSREYSVPYSLNHAVDACWGK